MGNALMHDGTIAVAVSLRTDSAGSPQHGTIGGAP